MTQPNTIIPKSTAPQPALPQNQQAKLDALVMADNLLELYYMVTILKEPELDSFIQHAKTLRLKTETHFARLLRSVKTSNEFKKELKKEIISSLEEDYESVKSEISSKRKKGFDVQLETIATTAIPAKIKLFAATENKNDYYRVHQKLDQIRQSLQQKIKFPEENPQPSKSASQQPSK